MVSYRPRLVAALSLALLLGLCITGASQRWCCAGCDCWELLRLLKMLLWRFCQAWLYLVCCYGQFDRMLWTVITRFMSYAHSYNMLWVFLLIIHIWQTNFDGQCWLLDGAVGVMALSKCTECTCYMLNISWFLSTFSIVIANKFHVIIIITTPVLSTRLTKLLPIYHPPVTVHISFSSQYTAYQTTPHLPPACHGAHFFQFSVHGLPNYSPFTTRLSRCTFPSILHSYFYFSSLFSVI